jgi:transposase
VKQIYERHGSEESIRGIAERLGISRNTVRKYLRSPGLPKPRPRPLRASKLAPFEAHLRMRLAEGLENCVVLLRELRAQGYTGSYTILKDYVQPRRRQRTAVATMRYETEPGEQAQVDFGHFTYLTTDGQRRSVWAFVMVLSWSRMLYVEFIARADTATFIRCHLNAFAYFGGVPRRCLYDNTKVVVLGRDAVGEPLWNPTFLDFALRVGFSIRLCRPYRAQTKGRVESGVKYVRRNFWPTARFVDLPDLNQQALSWGEMVAAVRVHGTTHERPGERWAAERPQLGSLPGPERLACFLREDRKVGRDGYVHWNRGWYGVPWHFAGQTVQVAAGETTVELWLGSDRLAVHPRASRPGQRFTVPGQWTGLPRGGGRRPQEALGHQVAAITVQQRSLRVYDQLVEVGGQR